MHYLCHMCVWYVGRGTSPPHSWIYRRFKSFWLKSYLRHDSKWSFQLGRDKVFKISDSHGIFVFISRSLRIKTYRILRILGCTVFRSKYDDMGWGEGQTTSRKENNYFSQSTSLNNNFSPTPCLNFLLHPALNKYKAETLLSTILPCQTYINIIM